jgi:hypothetical protein
MEAENASLQLARRVLRADPSRSRNSVPNAFAMRSWRYCAGISPSNATIGSSSFPLPRDGVRMIRATFSAVGLNTSLATQHGAKARANFRVNMRDAWWLM